jgi:hypothetical protein
MPVKSSPAVAVPVSVKLTVSGWASEPPIPLVRWSMKRMGPARPSVAVAIAAVTETVGSLSAMVPLAVD